MWITIWLIVLTLWCFTLHRCIINVDTFNWEQSYVFAKLIDTLAKHVDKHDRYLEKFTQDVVKDLTRSEKYMNFCLYKFSHLNHKINQNELDVNLHITNEKISSDDVKQFHKNKDEDDRYWDIDIWKRMVLGKYEVDEYIWRVDHGLSTRPKCRFKLKGIRNLSDDISCNESNSYWYESFANDIVKQLKYMVDEKWCGDVANIKRCDVQEAQHSPVMKILIDPDEENILRIFRKTIKNDETDKAA